MTEHNRRDALGNGFNEVDGFARDRRDDILGEGAVINGLANVIGKTAKRNSDIEINDELLAVLTLVIKDAVVGKSPQAAEPNFVGHASPRTHALRTSKARAVRPTS